MKITRINTIIGHRVFGNFSWPGDLPEFARFNLIYGWNGSGKTTLSNLLRHIEKKEAILEGDAEFHIDGKSCLGSSLSVGSSLPRIRVFNRDYVDANFFASRTYGNMFVVEPSLTPIFFLGEDSVEKQKLIEALRNTRDGENQTIVAKQTAKDEADNAVESFCKQQAKAIKELLRSSGANPYNNYDKSNFRQTCETQAKPGAPSKLLSEEKRNELKQQKGNKPKDRLSEVTVSLPDLGQLTHDAKGLLQRTVVSQVLDALAKDNSLAEWVRQGLVYHTGDNSGKECRFCGQPMPKDRLSKLEGHFNDEYNRFLREIDASVEDIEEQQTTLKELALPVKGDFYDHLSSGFVTALADFQVFNKQVAAYLGAIHTTLSQKRTKPFEVMPLEPFLANAPLPLASDGVEALSRINGLVVQHNTETDNFQTNVTKARKELEECMVAEALDDFKKKLVAIQLATTDLQALRDGVKNLSDQIAALEKQILEHLKPAEELNAELHSYLGRDELRFEVKETGYLITRNGSVASNLSEGERTAIAFLYFLKSLQDQSFNLAQDIVVIDDPVSSLDTNSLFCAFGYMKERTKEAGQLFVLTHNFGFFRQVKNWFNHLNKWKKPTQYPACFYMVEAGVLAGQRNASLRVLDPLLQKFDSEYHYLFKKVYDEANCGIKRPALEDYYAMPNIARRLLEAFLAFHFPAQSGELNQQLDQVAGFDPAKKARILRFLHTYSHDGKIGEPEHDLSILAETPQVLKELLELLATEDAKHFGEMVKFVSPSKAS